MAPTIINPPHLVVFPVVHYPENVNDALPVINPGYQTVAIVANVEDNAIANLVC
jgi:hypothetical protein